jgi:ABC-type xylose transport system permease subunit
MGLSTLPCRREGIPNLLLLTFAVFLFFYVILRFTTVGRNIYYIGSNIKKCRGCRESISSERVTLPLCFSRSFRPVSRARAKGRFGQQLDRNWSDDEEV